MSKILGTVASFQGAPGGLYPNEDTTLPNAASGTVTSVGTGTGLTGGPITSTGTISVANTAVTAGTYAVMDGTVNAQGQLTAASSHVSGVTPGSYTNSNITVDAHGIVTAAASGAGGTVTAVNVQGVSVAMNTFGFNDAGSTTNIKNNASLNVSGGCITVGGRSFVSLTGYIQMFSATSPPEQFQAYFQLGTGIFAGLPNPVGNVSGTCVIGNNFYSVLMWSFSGAGSTLSFAPPPVYMNTANLGSGTDFTAHFSCSWVV
jgi:hypothetical protein